MVKRNKAGLGSQNSAEFPDNTQNLITAARLRNYHADQADSFANVANVTAGTGRILMTGAVDTELADSSIVEGTTEVDFDKAVAFRPFINIGSSQIKVLGELVYLETSISNRAFSPMGAPFTTLGTANPMYVKLDAVEQLPAGANQAVRDETLQILAGQNMSFTQVGAAGTSHITRQFVIDLTQGGDVRLEIFVGTDDTGRKIVDQEFTGLSVGENTLIFETFPYINPSFTYFIRYTAITTVTIRGTTISTVFVPYSISSGWPFSEVRVLTDDDGAHIANLLEALSGDDRLDFNALRNTPSAGTAFLTATAIPVDVQVTSGVWEPATFSGVHLLYDSSQVTGDITSINASSSITFGADTFFAISNLDTEARTFTLDASLPAFSGFGSDRSFTLPARTTTLFFHDISSIAPVANYNVGEGGSDHPVIVARDTPSLSSLAQIAAASVGTNSGLWVVAADQLSANESVIDSSIQVRALRDGLLDANGIPIPTTATQKSGIILTAGTIVRVFSSTDLRVVITPTTATGARFPDLPTSGTLLHINTQALYNTHRNRTTVFTNSLATEVRLFQVQSPSAESIIIGFDDVFCFRNDGTGTLSIRTFQTGTTFSGGAETIALATGESLCISPVAPTAPQTGLFEVLQRGQLAGITTQGVIATDWYRDSINAVAANRPVRLYREKELTDGIVREHIKTATASNNPVTLRFQSRNVQDDIAWIQWWATFQPLQPLGTSVAEVEGNVAARLSTISSSINNGYDFEFLDPGVQFGVTSITFISGNTYRVNLPSALPTYIAVNDTLTISGAANAQNNGDFAVDAIAGDRLAFDITISPNNGASSNEGVGALVFRTIFADAVLVSHTLRQTNFNLYTDLARTVLLTTIPTEWFDITTTPAPANNVVAIGYNTDISITPTFIALQDDAGDFFLAKGGPRGSISFFDNRTSYNSGTNTLPTVTENIVIDTLGIATFLLPVLPDELPAGDTMRFRLHADSAIASTNDVRVVVGKTGDILTFDEGVSEITVLPGNYIDIEFYNDGNNSGVRFASPVQRSRTAAPTLTTPETMDTAQINPLPVSPIFVIVAQDEDPNENFIDADATNRRINLNANGDYTFDVAVTIQFSGTEPTSAFLFATASLVVITNRSAVDTEQSAFKDTISLEMERGGLSGAGAPKPQHTLSTRFDWQGRSGDHVRFVLRLDQIPAGFTAADFEVRDFSWSAAVQLGLN